MGPVPERACILLAYLGPTAEAVTVGAMERRTPFVGCEPFHARIPPSKPLDIVEPREHPDYLRNRECRVHRSREDKSLPRVGNTESHVQQFTRRLIAPLLLFAFGAEANGQLSPDGIRARSFDDQHVNPFWLSAGAMISA